MRRTLGLLGALALAGCASSASEEHRAEMHETRAQRAASAGDYTRAAHEQRRADEERREAHRRAVEEQSPPAAPYRTPGMMPLTDPTIPPPGAPY